jgi:hypothetical protein
LECFGFREWLSLVQCDLALSFLADLFHLLQVCVDLLTQ